MILIVNHHHNRHLLEMINLFLFFCKNSGVYVCVFMCAWELFFKCLCVVVDKKNIVCFLFWAIKKSHYVWLSVFSPFFFYFTLTLMRNNKTKVCPSGALPRFFRRRMCVIFLSKKRNKQEKISLYYK